MIQQIDLDQACAGMVLACALHDIHGSILLQQGSVLTDSSLASLRRRAITRIDIVPAGTGSATEAATATTAPPSQAELESRIAFVFRHCDNQANQSNQANQILRSAILALKLENAT